MNVSEVSKIIETIPIFENIIFKNANSDNQYGTIKVPQRHFKDSGKNEYRLDDLYHVFVAHMYKDLEKEFFYILVYHAGERRNYRCRNYYPVEYNKIFASGKTVDAVIENLTSQLVGYKLD